MQHISILVLCVAQDCFCAYKEDVARMDVKDKMTDVLMKLKMQRTKLGLAQDVVAQVLNVEQSMYAKLESGKSKINLEQLIKVMALLNLSFSDLDDSKSLPSTNAELELRQLRADVDRLILINRNNANIKKKSEREINI